MNDEFYTERVNAPLVAAIASLVVPGGGQLYNRYLLRGLAFFVGFSFTYVTIGVFAFVFTAGSVVEAVLVAMHEGRLRDGE